MPNNPSVVILVAGIMGSQFLWTDPSDSTAESQLIWPPGAGDLVEGYRWNTQLLSDPLELVDCNI
jgi:hypothetical protein